MAAKTSLCSMSLAVCNFWELGQGQKCQLGHKKSQSTRQDTCTSLLLTSVDQVVAWPAIHQRFSAFGIHARLPGSEFLFFNFLFKHLSIWEVERQ